MGRRAGWRPRPVKIDFARARFAGSCGGSSMHLSLARVVALLALALSTSQRRSGRPASQALAPGNFFPARKKSPKNALTKTPLNVSEIGLCGGSRTPITALFEPGWIRRDFGLGRKWPWSRCLAFGRHATARFARACFRVGKAPQLEGRGCANRSRGHRGRTVLVRITPRSRYCHRRIRPVLNSAAVGILEPPSFRLLRRIRHLLRALLLTFLVIEKSKSPQDLAKRARAKQILTGRGRQPARRPIPRWRQRHRRATE
jgi:hypothetical protein